MIECQERINDISREIENSYSTGNNDLLGCMKLLMDKNRFFEVKSKLQDELTAINTKMHGFELYIASI